MKNYFKMTLIFAIFLGFLAPILITAGTIPEGETVATMFQRSGALMVGLYVWVQFKIGTIDDLSWVYTFLARLCLIIGTVIWGFGDLILTGKI